MFNVVHVVVTDWSYMYALTRFLVSTVFGVSPANPSNFHTKTCFLVRFSFVFSTVYSIISTPGIIQVSIIYNFQYSSIIHVSILKCVNAGTSRGSRKDRTGKMYKENDSHVN